jgi:hypothetical protein
MPTNEALKTTVSPLTWAYGGAPQSLLLHREKNVSAVCIRYAKGKYLGYTVGKINKVPPKFLDNQGPA